MCRRDGLTGQSVLIMNNFEEKILSPDIQAVTKGRPAEVMPESSSAPLKSYTATKVVPKVDKAQYKAYGINDKNDTKINKFRQLDFLDKAGSSKPSEALASLKKATNDDALTNQDIANIEEFLVNAPSLPAKTEIFMKAPQNLANLAKGDAFNFDQPTIGSTIAETAAENNETGLVKIVNKKAAKPIAIFSDYGYRNEAMVSKDTKYKVVDQEPIMLNGKKSMLYTLGEQD